MLGWRKRKKQNAVVVTSDIAEAQRVRAEVVAQRSTLSRGLAYLAERREMNGFGDDLQITFTPRADEGLNRKPRHA